MNAIINKLQGNSYDVLKMLMALLVVSIHTQGFCGEHLINTLAPLNQVAVPVFFILTSLFYFKKVRQTGVSFKSLGQYVKRIGILYLFWFVVSLPYVMAARKYFIENGFYDIIRLVIDVMFRSTYGGSWFLSATVVSVVVYSIAHKIKYLPYIICSLSLLLLFYNADIIYIPSEYHVFYDWCVSYWRPEVRQTAMEGLAWVGIGYIYSNEKIEQVIDKIGGGIYCTIGVLAYIAILYNNINGAGFYNIFLYLLMAVAFTACATCYSEYRSANFYILRKASVLFFFLHQPFLWFTTRILKFIYGGERTYLYEYVGYFNSYIITILFCMLIACLIMFLQQKYKFNWLKYCY